ncbi:hypothetical protein HA630_17410 [Aquabacterium sp. A08]|nr:hypothetical protein [Aquabacterium sp. A08]
MVPKPTAPPPAPAPAAPPPPTVPSPAPASELDILRGALQRCDAKDNLLSKGACILKARHKHCGSLWGQVPECPLSNNNVNN